MTNRRNFIKATVSAAVATHFLAASGVASAAKKGPTLKPKRLKAGDNIGLIAPSSNTWENEDIYFAIDVLKSFGFKVTPGDHLFDRHGYLAGKDKDRAADVNKMFADKDIDAIYCLRGGYGSPRMLPFLDFDTIGKNPKVLVGYSDVTALLNAIHAKTGLVTFHGPIAKQNFSDYTLANFKKVLFQPNHNFELAKPPVFESKEGQAEKANRLTTIVPGKATGRLIGGNLSLLVQLVGTPYEPDYKNKILFLEDVEEEPYRIDGMLTHLLVSGRLNKLAGVVFGKCTDCETKRRSLTIEQVLNDRLGVLNIPALRGLMIGHIEDMATIPVGVVATLDASKKTLTLNETAVS
ncbi:MAG: LD-carboxypeptidase [Kangiellaceae bacterium]|nr:LD-carboxypeptidase [Kangiellaceae bacterium]